VVETGGLENRFTRKGNGGSNPSPSAIPRSYYTIGPRSDPTATADGLLRKTSGNPLHCSITCLNGCSGVVALCDGQYIVERRTT
jgi:hypothetical protein